LEHLEAAGYTRVAKIFKDEMTNGPSKTNSRAGSGSRERSKQSNYHQSSSKDKDQKSPQQLLL